MKYLKEYDYGFYASSEWRQKRREILKRDNYECQLCKLRGRYNKATVVHHLKHYDKFPKLALTSVNLVSLCAACHNVVHPEKNLSKRKPVRPERWE